MVRPSRRSLVLAALAVVALAAALWSRGSMGREPVADAGPVTGPRASEAALPRIGLERLASAPSEPPSAERDVFRFGRPSPPPPVSVPAPAAALPQVEATPVAPTTTTLPPFAVKYVGSAEKGGVRVAILLSDDRKEILTGREGEVVANRLRIVRIGYESVEVQDVGSDRVRRIPLRGN